SDDADAAENAREAKKRIGSIGARVRRSQVTKHTSTTQPAANASSALRLPHPTLPVWISPQTKASRPVPDSRMPSESSRRTGPCDSVRRARASGISAIPTGTLIQKIQCHESADVRAPPRTGPSEAAPPATAPQAPSTAPRRSGGVAAERI